VVHPRCAGIDISKRDAKVCVRIQGSGKRRTASTVTTWGAVTNQILALQEHLVEQKVTCVVMEVLRVIDLAHGRGVPVEDGSGVK